MSLKLRYFDFLNEDCGQLFDLFELTYGDAVSFYKRWNWEYIENPRKEHIKILVAEDVNRIAGSTSRLPFTLKVGDELIDAYFSVDSMVHPDYRRRGIMKRLYNKSAQDMPLLFSKGSTEGMYKLLMNFGYRPVEPNNFMGCILSPFKWALWRMGALKSKGGQTVRKEYQYGDFERVTETDDSGDKFFENVSIGYYGIPIRNNKYLEWRYFSNPFREYHVFRRRSSNATKSMVVLTIRGSSASIVDVLWDTGCSDEPETSVEFAKVYAKHMGCHRIHCWSTYGELRKTLKRCKFFENKETPRFSVFGATHDLDLLSDGGKFHFVHGDGDTEFVQGR